MNYDYHLGFAWFMFVLCMFGKSGLHVYNVYYYCFSLLGIRIGAFRSFLFFYVHFSKVIASEALMKYKSKYKIISAYQ